MGDTYAELCGIASKTMGLADPLRRSLALLASRIRTAFIDGSLAKRQDAARSDIDLMLESDELSYPDVFGALKDASRRLGREVKPTTYTRKERADRAARGDGFI